MIFVSIMIVFFMNMFLVSYLVSGGMCFWMVPVQGQRIPFMKNKGLGSAVDTVEHTEAAQSV